MSFVDRIVDFFLMLVVNLPLRKCIMISLHNVEEALLSAREEDVIFDSPDEVEWKNLQFAILLLNFAYHFIFLIYKSYHSDFVRLVSNLKQTVVQFLRFFHETK